MQAILWNFDRSLVQPRVPAPPPPQSTLSTRTDYDIHVTVRFTKSGRFSFLVTWLSLMKFSSCKPWHLLDGFQAVRKTIPCQEANTTHPLLRYIPETRNLSVAKVMGKIILQVHTEPYAIYTDGC